MTVCAWLVVLGAEAAPPPATNASEEVIVYADDFARWDNTRWLVETELMLPMGTTLGSDTNRAFRTHALQMRGVVTCEKDARLGKRGYEVGCTIEDVALIVTTDDLYHPSAQPTVQAILDELDAKLSGAVVQLQVDRDGGVTNVDLEGLTTDNYRERTIQESLRQLTGRLMAGFHARIPDHAQRTGQWLENRSGLMTIPSDLGVRGSSQILHQVSAQGDLRIVQSEGKGMVAVTLANPLVDLFPDVNEQALPAPSLVASTPSASVGFIDKMADVNVPPLPAQAHVAEPTTPTGAVLDMETTFDLSMSGVAVFNKPTGIMSERVWAVLGTATGSSYGGSVVSTAPYVHRGRILMLGTDDHPDVGASKQVAWPGFQGAGLDPWVPM